MLMDDTYINTQQWFECQVVSALNAYAFHTGKSYAKSGSSKYYSLVKMARARHGPAIRIGAVHKKLGLKAEEFGSLYQSKTRKGRIRLPLEISVWHKRYGFHSVLVVGQCLKTSALQITNFKEATTSEGWIFEEDLCHYDQSHNRGVIGRCRRLLLAD